MGDVSFGTGAQGDCKQGRQTGTQEAELIQNRYGLLDSSSTAL